MSSRTPSPRAGAPIARTLAAAIAERLRQDILSGAHAPGAALKQDVLAQAYAVSRIPVREALLQLEAEGLVVIHPHRGAVVTPMSRAEIDDVFALRGLLETRLIDASLPHLTRDDIARLGEIDARFAQAMRAGDVASFGALNAELHLAMYVRAGQPRTLAVVTGLLQTSERYTRLQLSTRETWRRAQAEHAELIDLCRRRARVAARRLLARHITAVHADVTRLVAEREDAPPRLS